MGSIFDIAKNDLTIYFILFYFCWFDPSSDLKIQICLHPQFFFSSAQHNLGEPNFFDFMTFSAITASGSKLTFKFMLLERLRFSFWTFLLENFVKLSKLCQVPPLTFWTEYILVGGELLVRDIFFIGFLLVAARLLTRHPLNPSWESGELLFLGDYFPTMVGG